MNRNRSLFEGVIADISPVFFSDFEKLTNKSCLAMNKISSSYKLNNEKDRVVFIAEAMGLVKDDIEMSIKDKHLTVTSKCDNKSPFVSRLSHTIYVGDNIDRDRVSAQLERGVLTINMPLQESKKDFQIKF